MDMITQVQIALKMDLRNSHDNLLPEHMALTTKDLEVRKTNLSTRRPESLTLYIKDSHPKTKPLKDLLCKDIALRDVVP